MAALFVALQSLLPHHLLCRFVYALTRSRWPWLKNGLISAFMRGYRPDMGDAAEPEPLRYPSFNAFFTRELRPGARPPASDPSLLVSPCDGTLSVAARIEQDRLLQAKGHEYSVEGLLAGEMQWARRLSGGRFATIYLAPYNYHRVHMPLEGRLVQAWHVPGRLFSVNAATVRRVPNLFARNERVVCAFEGEYGCFVLVLVGALFVGSMSTVWHGDLTPWRLARRHHVPAVPGARFHPLAPLPGSSLWQPRGAELGRFNMGSTVVLLLPRDGYEWLPEAPFGQTLRIGEPLARRRT